MKLALCAERRLTFLIGATVGPANSQHSKFPSLDERCHASLTYFPVTSLRPAPHQMLKLTRHHFVIAVPDLQKSAAFYRNVLGFTIHPISDPGWLFYRSGDCTIMAGECRDA